MDYLVCTLLIGAGATAVMDIWAVARKRLLGIPSLGLWPGGPLARLYNARALSP